MLILVLHFSKVKLQPDVETYSIHTHNTRLIKLLLTVQKRKQAEREPHPHLGELLGYMQYLQTALTSHRHKYYST